VEVDAKTQNLSSCRPTRSRKYDQEAGANGLYIDFSRQDRRHPEARRNGLSPEMIEDSFKHESCSHFGLHYSTASFTTPFWSLASTILSYL